MTSEVLYKFMLYGGLFIVIALIWFLADSLWFKLFKEKKTRE